MNRMHVLEDVRGSLGSARASRACAGALAGAFFSRPACPENMMLVEAFAFPTKFVAARRRNQHARARALPR